MRHFERAVNPGRAAPRRGAAGQFLRDVEGKSGPRRPRASPNRDRCREVLCTSFAQWFSQGRRRRDILEESRRPWLRAARNGPELRTGRPRAPSPDRRRARGRAQRRGIMQAAVCRKRSRLRLRGRGLRARRFARCGVPDGFAVLTPHERRRVSKRTSNPMQSAVRRAEAKARIFGTFPGGSLRCVPSQPVRFDARRASRTTQIDQGPL